MSFLWSKSNKGYACYSDILCFIPQTVCWLVCQDPKDSGGVLEGRRQEVVGSVWGQCLGECGQACPFLLGLVDTRLSGLVSHKIGKNCHCNFGAVGRSLHASTILV